MRERLSRVGRGRLYGRVFLLNAAIFIIATLVLVITPATISFPVELTEAIVVVAGLTAILVLNAIALRAAFAPLERLMRLMRAIDPYRPGERLDATGPEEVREFVAVFNEMLDRLEHERRESVRRALAAQESERRRVSQDLHDDVGQVLTGVLLRLEALARRAPPELMPDVRAAQDTTREAVDQVSRVIRQLRPEALADLGLGTALAALADRVQETSGLPVRVRIAPDLGELGEERELVVYRVAQESLTNAVRHAEASEIELTLERTATGVVLRIEDNGRGLPATWPPRYGILGMQERAMLIGASLELGSRHGGGTEVTLTVPLGV